LKNKQEICLNCDQKLTPEDNFCAHCGQKARYNDLSFGSLFRNFLDNFLNFDVRIFRSFRDLWIPNKITKLFAAGKRTSHVHPFRFYFITLVLFFSLLSLNIKDWRIDDQTHEEIVGEYKIHDKLSETKSFIDSTCGLNHIDSIKKKVFNKRILLADSTTNMHLGFADLKSYGITQRDFYLMHPDTLFTKYKVTDKFEKYSVRHSMRLQRDPEAALRYGISNMLWGIILITVLMSFVLKLLFIRHKAYLIEHFLHISHFHCLALFLISCILLVNLFYKTGYIPFIVVAVFSILHLIYSLKKYYNQGFIKILFKSLVISMAYLLSFSIVITIIFAFTAISF